jgi:nucleoside-diphosphate-sugar epimerase
MKRAVVLGAGGFIGSHMVNRLKVEGFEVIGADLKLPEYSESKADQFHLGDLRSHEFVASLLHENMQGNGLDQIYQFAADMGGAGFVFSGANDADIMHNSAVINLNVLDVVSKFSNSSKSNVSPRIFYSSSACMYPEHNQLDPENPNCAEDSAYPANPDSEYGWEKLFSERLFLAFNRNHGIDVRIARYHNIFGPEGTWQGGREKAPAAMCRKVLEAKNGSSIEIWGDGLQTRSFLYIDECIEATYRLMCHQTFIGPVNIGSEEMVTINELADIAIKFSGKELKKTHITGPLGVRGRNSDNRLIREVLDWDYKMKLEEGILETFNWIKGQMGSSVL